MHATIPGRKTRPVAAGLLLLAILSSAGCATTATVAQRFDRLDAFALRKDVSGKDVVDKVNELFANDYAPESLAVLSVPDLDDLFHAMEYASFYGDDRAVEKMERVLKVLQSRGAASRRHYAHMLQFLVQSRRFERARAIYAEASRLGQGPTPPPEFIGLAEPGWQGPTELTVAAGARQLARVAVDLSGPRIVVSWHPNCHFSRDAYRDIAASPSLSRLFQRYGKLLAPVDSAYELDALQDWNRGHPGAQVSIAYSLQEWPVIDLSQMPVFHFLRDGELVAKVVGLPADGGADEFLAAAEAAGMLEQDVRR